MPRPTAPPILKTPINKFQYAHDRVVALETAANNAAAAVAAAFAGGITSASRLAAWQAAYDAAIAAGANDYEANLIAEGAVLGFITRRKADTAAHAQAFAAMSALSTLAAAVAAMADPCNLGPDTAAIASMLLGPVDAASIKVALQDLINAGGY